MLASQTHALRASEIRKRLAELAAIEEMNDEQRSEIGTLRTEYADVEAKYQAAVTAEDTPTETRSDDAEGRELRSLIDGSDVGAIFTATMEHRVTDGRTAELQQHFGLGANQVPLALLETRAVTPAPGQVAQNQSAIIPGVFPMSCASFLGVEMPTVPVGESVFPVLTKNADVHTPAENAAAAETTGSFSAQVLSPSRLQASFFYSREDRARFSGMDEALRMNLSDALGDALDKEILVGTNGLLTGTVLSNHAVTAATTYANYRALFGYGRVDGVYAGGVGDIKIVMGSATYAHASGVFRSDNAGDRAALEDLMQVTAGVKVSAHIPDAANNKQNSVIRLGMRRDMVAPIWEGISLIPDEITKAGTGQIVVTAVMLHAIKILRAGGFYKQQAQHRGGRHGDAMERRRLPGNSSTWRWAVAKWELPLRKDGNCPGSRPSP